MHSDGSEVIVFEQHLKSKLFGNKNIICYLTASYFRWYLSELAEPSLNVRGSNPSDFLSQCYTIDRSATVRPTTLQIFYRFSHILYFQRGKIFAPLLSKENSKSFFKGWLRNSKARPSKVFIFLCLLLL